MGDRVGGMESAATKRDDNTNDTTGEGVSKKERPAEVAELMERASKRRKKKEAANADLYSSSTTTGGGSRKGGRHDIFMEGGSILDSTGGLDGSGGVGPQ